MIKVFFETSRHAELVAIFKDEATYLVCLPALEKLALEQCFDRVTESVEDIDISSLVAEVGISAQII